MISPELRKDLLAAVKKLNSFDHPSFTVNPRTAKNFTDGHHYEFIPPYRMIFSRSYDPEKGKLCRTLSISWEGGKPFSKDDIPEWQPIVEEGIGTKLGMCGFMFADQKRIYCLW